MNNSLKFGWAEVDISPSEKIKIAGQFYERISDVIETPITVTALAVETNEDQAVFCSCDLACISEGLVDRVREIVSLDPNGLNPQKIMINATHTHTSYEYDELDRLPYKKDCSAYEVILQFIPKGKRYIKNISGKAMDPHDALLFLAKKIAEAVKSAWQNRDNGYYANSFGRAAVGMCRRVVYEDGSARMWGDSNRDDFARLEGGNDSGIELLFVYDSNKKLSGIVANVACPAQVLEQRYFISSDYWGKLKIFLRERFGDDLKLLCLTSPAGDQCPRDLVRWVDPETPIEDPNVEKRKMSRFADPSMYDIKGTQKIAKRLANEIFDCYDELDGNLKSNVSFSHTVEHLQFPIRRATEEEYINAVTKLNEFFDTCPDEINYIDNAHLYVYAGTIVRYKEQDCLKTIPVELHFLRLGDIAFATFPFEVYLDYGNIIRARSESKQTFLIQMSCGNLGYLPTEKAEKGGHYSAYISSGKVGHEGGKALVEMTLDHIKKFYEED